MKILHVLILSYFIQGVANAQNLIANSSFETLNFCEEFSVGCAPSCWFTTSPFLSVYSTGFEGRGVGITVYNTTVPNVRKYIQTKLLCPLVKDQVYILSLKLKAEQAIVSSIGVAFSDSFLYYSKDELIKRKPDLDLEEKMKNLPSKKLKKWTEFQIEYKANGTEQFIIIGNFQEESDQKRVELKEMKVFMDCIYLIDDVMLVSRDSMEICESYNQNMKMLKNCTKRHSENIFLFETPQDQDEIVPVNPSEEEIAEKETERVDSIRLSDVLFEFNASKPGAESVYDIKAKFAQLDKNTIESIAIYGYTDSSGDEVYNQRLSQKRAEAIKEVLLEMGFEESVFTCEGRGESNPITTGSEESEMKKNRRIELIITYK